AYSAIKRVRFPRSGYWWAVLALLVILSMGTSVQVANARFDLPGRWLWRLVPVFRLTRNPARFNLLAAVAAGILLAAAVRDLLGRLRRPWVRGLVLAGLTAVLIVDLGIHPFSGTPLPEMPRRYREFAARGERPALLEIPGIFSAAPWTLTSTCA